VLCWRNVPTDSTQIGQVAKKCEPYMRQVFVTGDQDAETLKRQVICLRSSYVRFQLVLVSIHIPLNSSFML